MKSSIKIVVTVKLKKKLKVVDVNIDKPVTVNELLKMVSDILDYNLTEKLITDNTLVPEAEVLLEDVSIEELNNLDTLIEKDTVVSIYLA